MTRSVKVSELAEQIRGVTFAKADASRAPGNGLVPVLRASNIQDGALHFKDLIYVPAVKVRAQQKVRKNDVVITTSSGSLKIVGKAALSRSDFEGGFGAFLKVLRPRDGMDPGYFAHFFQTPEYRRKVSALAAGANINNLRNEHLDDLEMPLPPLPEQRRIAAILDHAEALRGKRRQALNQLDALAQSVFHDMFGDPDAATETVLFRDIADLSGGRNLVASDAMAPSAYRVLKISAVTTGQFDAAESKPLPEGYEPPQGHLVRPGDLLMSRANTSELVGAVAYVRDTPPNLALPDKVWRFDWRDPRSVPTFYHGLFQTKSIRRRISRLASGTGGSMKNVSKAKLQTMKLPRVDFSGQLEFAARFDSVASQAFVAVKAESAADELFASLQSRAFRGEL